MNLTQSSSTPSTTVFLSDINDFVSTKRSLHHAVSPPTDSNPRRHVRYPTPPKHTRSRRIAQPTTPPTLQHRVYAAIARWESETATSSSVTECIAHPLFLTVVAMGEPILSHLFEFIKDNPTRSAYWLTALQAITQHNPVPQSDMTDAQRSRTRWLAWGTSNGYLH